ncbi:MAG: hypothetical protein OHK0040_01730 [bacterium]
MDGKKKVVFLTPADAKYGFSLAGVIHYEITADDLQETLERLVKDEALGIIVVDERLTTEIKDDVMKDMEKKFAGVILVLPSPEKPLSEDGEYISRLIKKAIGYYVRLT